MRPDELYMAEALKEARKAAENGDVPVGCVVVVGGDVIARGHNQVELLRDPTAHAEMIAITSACERMGSKWLIDASVYVTIEPCSMCSGALVLARVKELVYGADDPKTGACGSVFNIIDNKCLNHRVHVRKGVLQEQCAFVVSEFFKKKRAAGNK
ncbi:MAG: tRNA adenosine(34) deaminase TadA [Deltaproteobacteria bacterium]